MELITHKQAADMLGVSLGTIRQAVARGDLTRYPKPGQTQHLIKEQALLFTNPKTRLAVRLLSAEKQKQWYTYDDSVNQPVQVVQTHIDADNNISVELAVTEIVKAIASVGSEAVQLLSEKRIDHNNHFLSPVAG